MNIGFQSRFCHARGARFAACLLSAVATLAGGAALAQTPLRLIVGFRPGATSDTMTRAIAEGMRAGFERPVIVENRAGGGGLAAALFVKSITVFVKAFGHSSTSTRPAMLQALDEPFRSAFVESVKL